jgi:multidrug resistance efflux pump
MKKKLLIGLVAAILVIAGVAVWLWSLGPSNVLRIPGIVEIQEVRLGSKVGGRVEAILVQEGDVVEGGAPLVRFEAPELKNQKAQMLARLDSAEADLARALKGPRYEELDAAKAAADSAKAKYERVKFGWRVEEKQQALNDLQSAEADYKQALEDFARAEPLFKRNAIARADYDAYLATRDRARGRKEFARAKVEMMKAGSRPEDIAEAKAEWEKMKAQHEQLVNGTRLEDIAVARAKVAELRANIEAIDINLAETTVVVPANLGKAVVEVMSVRPGDLVPANQPVVRVLRVQDLWVKIYVPETQYGLVPLGKEVDVTIDSHPGKHFKGIVTQRANISEFTPRNIQSVDERRNQVFGVKIFVKDAQGILNAGMAAEVTIPLD